MDDPIDIEVRIAGLEAAVRGMEGLTSSLVAEGQAAQGAARSTDATEQSFSELVRGSQSVVQRIQGVASAVQGLVSAFGSRDRTAGLVASIAGTTSQFASMGAMLGPGGALIGGLAGLTTGLVSAARAASDANRDFHEMLTTLGRAGSVESLAAISENAWNVLEGLRVTEAAELERDLANQADDVLTRMMAEAETDLATRRGGGGARDTRWDGAAMTEDALASFTDINSPEEIERRAAADAEYAAQAEELANDEIERLAREGDAQAELFELKEELRSADLEAEREKQDYLRDLEEQAAEAREDQIETLMGYVGRSSKAIFTAIAQVATGAKTGEEAFIGLLKSFLEMISEYAALKAATEFADAAASFARYDYGGGAAHVGAGLAFTAVAVATGVGAAAIGTGAPQAPARPEPQAEAQGGGGNVTYVVNWNSPVVTAGTRAELGRDIAGLMSEAEAA